MEKINVYEVLKGRFPASEYALMAEVSDAAGFARSRSADFIAVGLWPSRGLPVIGIELKSFRGDWLKELKTPAKAENIYKYCDYFWLLTADDTIAKLEEIPLTWGWMVIKGGKTKTMKEAPKLTPEPVSRHFMCAMMKRAADKTDFVHKSTIQERIDKSYQNGIDYQKKHRDHLLEDAEKMKKTLNDFKEYSGIELSEWRWSGTDPKKAGEAIKMIANGELESIKKEFQQLKLKAERISASIIESLEILNDEGSNNNTTGVRGSDESPTG